jgi:hypothetical protein
MKNLLWLLETYCIRMTKAWNTFAETKVPKKKQGFLALYMLSHYQITNVLSISQKQYTSTEIETRTDQV